MEEPIKEQSSDVASGNSSRLKLQRYALRSATKSKEEKPHALDSSNSGKPKRGRNTSSVTKSMGVLDFSGKDKSGSAKPLRRFSNPSKASTTQGAKMDGNDQGRSETPISETFKTLTRTKLNPITSASYWLDQIKISEFASEHSISLGFFKLALVAGCEPLQQMQEGLKAYVSTHQLSDLGETVKELFESYNISENAEHSQVSEAISQVPEEGTRSSDDDVHSSSSSMGIGKLKPKCLNIDSTQLTPTTESTNKKDPCEKTEKRTPVSRVRGTPNPRSVKKLDKPSKQEASKEKVMIKKRQGKKSEVKEDPGSIPQENKENMETQTTEDISIMTEEVV